jgi:NAD(P)-dependent dehydrogenase (short-subunit alcohol dehydrogenase family)
MEPLEDRVAVVTGGGSGIGEGLAHACAAAGMRVVLGDVEEKEVSRVAADLVAKGARALAVPCDVTRRAALDALADAAWSSFGGCHLLCNNAGVLVQGALADASDADWSWVLDVNLRGVVNGLQAFVPRMLAQGGEAHIVNTASMAGLCVLPDLGIYTASKFAVVGLSESLRMELAPRGIGVSVLCPGGVSTRIIESDRNRPDGVRACIRRDDAMEDGPVAPTDEEGEAASGIEDMQTPDEVAARVLEAVRDDLPYVITHPSWKPRVEARSRALLAAFERAAKRRQVS